MNHVSMYLLTGISFAGKSVLAQALSQARGWKVIDPDAVAHEHGQGLHGEFLSDEQWAGIHQEAEQRAGALLRAGESIIYDTTAVTRQPPAPDEAPLIYRSGEDISAWIQANIPPL